MHNKSSNFQRLILWLTLILFTYFIYLALYLSAKYILKERDNKYERINLLPISSKEKSILRHNYPQDQFRRLLFVISPLSAIGLDTIDKLEGKYVEDSNTKYMYGR